MVFLIHLFILWCKQSSELSSEFLCFVCQRGRVQNEFKEEKNIAEGNLEREGGYLAKFNTLLYTILAEKVPLLYTFY